jgi:LacI family transcriptional regulator
MVMSFAVRFRMAVTVRVSTVDAGTGTRRSSDGETMRVMLGRPGAVTLRDIAEETGVSVNTVSRALTGKHDINVETKARVMAAAERLGYTPNLMARSLVQGRTRTIGLLVTDCTHPFYATLIREVEKVAAENRYGLLLATSNEDPLKEEAAVHLLSERRVDGLLLSPVSVDAPHIRALLRAKLPTVLLARRPPGYKGPFVGTDNVKAARLAVRHLLDLGHRHIAHVTRADSVASAVERLEGYRRELKRARVTFKRSLVLAAPQTIEGARAIVPRLIEVEPRPSAVFTYSDLQAVGVLAGLRQLGISVPTEMSVVGFDGLDLTRYVTPALTTVAQSTEQIGRVGAEMLINLLSGRRCPLTHLLPGSLIVRDSSARSAVALDPQRPA